MKFHRLASITASVIQRSSAFSSGLARYPGLPFALPASFVLEQHGFRAHAVASIGSETSPDSTNGHHQRILGTSIGSCREVHTLHAYRVVENQSASRHSQQMIGTSHRGL